MIVVCGPNLGSSGAPLRVAEFGNSPPPPRISELLKKIFRDLKVLEPSFA